MTETEQEILEYLKKTWLRMRLGIAVLIGCIALLWIFVSSISSHS